MAAQSPFQRAFPVRSPALSRRFDVELLGCPEGRSSADWVDFDFLGRQNVALVSPQEPGHGTGSAVDGHQLPMRHCGVVPTMLEEDALAEKPRAAGIRFVIEPCERFKDLVGEQATVFFLEPCGYGLKFKAIADRSQLFAK